MKQLANKIRPARRTYDNSSRKFRIQRMPPWLWNWFESIWNIPGVPMTHRVWRGTEPCFQKCCAVRICGPKSRLRNTGCERCRVSASKPMSISESMGVT